MTSTAPGSAPTLSTETKANLPSGAYAIPCGSCFDVGIRAASVRVAASNNDTLRSFLFVTITHLPSGDGSTLYAPCPVGTARRSCNGSDALQVTYKRRSSGDTD